MEIILKSKKLTKKLKVNHILKKTNAEMFKNVEIDDILELSIIATRVGSTMRGGSNAAIITIKNLTKNESTQKTFNQIDKALSPFELIELN